jgi:hypothetical protein
MPDDGQKVEQELQEVRRRVTVEGNVVTLVARRRPGLEWLVSAIVVLVGAALVA